MSETRRQQLRILGEVQQPQTVQFEDVREHPCWEPDLSQHGARWPFGGLPLQSVVDGATPTDQALRVRIRCSTDNFEREVAWEDLRPVAWLVCSDPSGYPLTPDQGGPFRLWISGHSACGISELDACANIKHLDEITFLSSAPS